MMRIDRNRLAIRRSGSFPLVLHPEQHAVVVVRVGQVEAKGDDRAVVLLRLPPVADAAIQRNQVRVRLRDRRVARQRLLVCGNRAVQIASFSKLQAALQTGLRIVAQRHDPGEHRIVQARPARTISGMALERALGLVAAPEGAMGQGERVVRRTPLGK